MPLLVYAQEKKLIPFLLLNFSLNFAAFSQTLNFTCGTRETGATRFLKTTTSIASHHGVHLPSRDTIRALVVYVHFPEDRTFDEVWEIGYLPLWWKKYAAELKNYFYEQSYSTLVFECETHPKPFVLPFSQAQYLTDGRTYGEAAKDIIRGLDSTYDFTRFDRWSSQDHPYSINKGQDGKVDILIVLYRNASGSFIPWSGVSELGFEGYVFVDSMQRFFYGGNGRFSDAGASGVTLCKPASITPVMDYNYAFGISAHEIMHKIYGEGHPAWLFGGLGLMGASGAGMGLNSFEKHILSYITFQTIPFGIDTTITLHDYMTTKEAFLLPLPQRDGMFYSFEYRRKISPYDTAPIEGVYIYRINNAGSFNQKEVIVQSADGKWIWRYDDALRRPVKAYADPLAGLNKLQAIPVNGKNTYADGWWGDANDAFTMQRSFFSFFRNPSPDFVIGSDTVRTGLDVRILAMSDSTATLSIRYNTPATLDVDRIDADSYSLAANFPNPARRGEAVTIPISTSLESHVRIELFNLLGKKIQTIVDERILRGTHLLQISTDALHAGMYLCSITIDGKKHVRRISIME